ncbi:hypothetical protein ACWGJ9_18375 [Curtobacterium citreum]
MRFINWLVGVLGAVGRGLDANHGGPGVPPDAARWLADNENDHQRRRDYRP